MLAIGASYNPIMNFFDTVNLNPNNHELLQGLRELNLPQCWLVAGCLFQTVWNVQTQQDPTAQINDYDVFYFDASDLSKGAEDEVCARVNARFTHLPITIETKNQARVHTWYEDYFHEPYSALASSEESLERFLIACTCIGISIPPDRVPDARDVRAVNGFDDLYAGLLRPNWQHRRALFDAKAQSYMRRWAHLRTGG
jgi:uncharacterized protein